MNKPSPVVTSVYVKMRDGVRLAVDIWRSNAVDSPRPALLLSTRYWRSFALAEDQPSLQGIYALASYFTAQGFVVVNVDSRGSGASFGARRTEWSDEEVADMGEIIDWIARQSWSDGRVVSHGFSYGGNTAFLAAVSGHPALRAIAPQFADIDIYRHNLFPGGVPNRWLREDWGKLTAAMDCGDIAAMSRLLPAIDGDSFRQMVKGPRPVDADKDTVDLPLAIADHKPNFNMARMPQDCICLDDPVRYNAGAAIDQAFDCDRLSIYARRHEIEKSNVPIFYWAGWFDAGTAAGALDLFSTFSNPMRVIIGPWGHGRRYVQDPFTFRDVPSLIALEENYADIRQSICDCLDGVPSQGRILEYFTLGENKWKSTHEWPLPHTKVKRLYLQRDQQLASCLPLADEGADRYVIDPTATTGANNRWHTQIGCIPVYHEDRRAADAKCFAYDSEILEDDIEITGSPAVHVFIKSDVADLALFAYLEMIAPDHSVRLLSEGCLRAIHRKISTAGPLHSYERKDMEPLTLGEITQMAFSLLPISIRIPAGYRLRLALSGADKDTFEAIPDAAGAAVSFLRNQPHASYLELPIIP